MNNSQKDLPKIRTFAQDLEVRRADQKINPKNDQPAPAKVTEKPIEQSSDNKPLVKNVTEDKKEEETIKENPPFHSINKNSELSKKLSAEIETITKRESEKKPESILSNKKVGNVSLQDVDDEITANIITDTKRNRFNLGSAVVAGISSWWSAQQAEKRKKKQPKYIVEQAELRKGVIQEATSITAKASTADHKAVINRIRDKQKAEKLPKPATAIVEKKTPTWEKVGETPLQNLVTAEQVVNKNISNVKVEPRLSTNTDKKVVISTGAVPKSTPESEPVKLAAPKKDIQPASLYQTPTVEKKEFVAPTPLIDPVTTPVVPVVPPPQPPVAVKVPSAPVVPTAPAETAVVIPPPPTKTPDLVATVQTKPATAAISRSKEAVSIPVRTERDDNRKVSFRSTNTLTMAVASFIGLVVIGTIAFTVVKDRINSNIIAPQEVTAYFGSQNLVKQNLSIINKETVRLAVAQSDHNNDLTEIALVDSEGNEHATESILSIFTNISESIISNSNYVRFGHTNGNGFVLISINNKNAALGGMLQWEYYLERDLRDFISSPSGDNNPTYTDRTINNTDVRSLVTSEGEGLTYGFIDNNHILITGDFSTFAIVAEKNR